MRASGEVAYNNEAGRVISSAILCGVVAGETRLVPAGAGPRSPAARVRWPRAAARRPPPAASATATPFPASPSTSLLLSFLDTPTGRLVINIARLELIPSSVLIVNELSVGENEPELNVVALAGAARSKSRRFEYLRPRRSASAAAVENGRAESAAAHVAVRRYDIVYLGVGAAAAVAAAATAVRSPGGERVAGAPAPRRPPTPRRRAECTPSTHTLRGPGHGELLPPLCHAVRRTDTDYVYAVQCPPAPAPPPAAPSAPAARALNTLDLFSFQWQREGGTRSATRSSY
ncbi:hypothetical protein EVAR_95174_1 [Eumeta japonica]|uniref:Uncharacterized protein n=1 Tax=Eumeta variegata TaxID=151549 RepID=A0A4C1VHJ5_EUMVA|nr:hypothetical protein EVAR_95174_1 [Eumeta japonica]